VGPYAGAVSSDPREPDVRHGRRRPEWDEYFMLIAVATRQRAECIGRHVGAVVVRDERIVATGYNGTPRGFPRCNESERGCHRCANREQYPAGSAYDVCICVHAEQNALLQAAKLGYSVQGSHCYTTLRPCFGCLKELYQAGVSGIRYLNSWSPSDPREAAAYGDLLAEMATHGVSVDQLELPESLLDLRASA
jgi:dCMP deaminase